VGEGLSGYSNHHQVEDVEQGGRGRSQVEGGEGENDGGAGGAGDECRKHRRDESIPCRFQDSHAHDGGDIASVSEDKRDDGFPVEPDPVHDGVHEKSGSREIAQIFQQGEAKEEGDQVGEHDAYAAGKALDQSLQDREVK
jgi:hypothetical protein